MASQQFERTDRIASELVREVERIIREDVNDPRTKCLFSITHAEVTRDLRYAKVYISILEEEKRGPMMQALKKASGYIRRILGQKMELRYTPEILFHLDTSIEYGVHIADVLGKLGVKEEDLDGDK